MRRRRFLRIASMMMLRNCKPAGTFSSTTRSFMPTLSANMPCTVIVEYSHRSTLASFSTSGFPM